MAVWSSKYKSSLPKSSYAWVDNDGNGHLPYKDADGTIDLPHVRAALSRLNQVQGMNDEERATVRAKLQRILQAAKVKASLTDMDRITLSTSTIMLDASGDVPTRVPLLTTFNLPDSVKGDFVVTVDDLKECKQNFDAGIGFPTNDATTGLKIDFEHKWLGKAAGWIKGLELEIDENDPSRATLYGNPVEWSKSGLEAIKGGDYKMFSPMGMFGITNGVKNLWTDLNNMKTQIANVLEGGAVTGAPYQKMMSPIRASMLDATVVDDGQIEDDEDDVVDPDKQTIKEKSMELSFDKVRLMERKNLTVPQLDVLAENRQKLSAEELTKFHLEEPTSRVTLSAEDKKTLADLHEGRVQLVSADQAVIDKQQLSALEGTAEEYRTEKAEAIVDGHIKTGRIKMDSREFWVKQLLDASGDARKALEDQLAALPEKKELSQGEIGHREDADPDVMAELKKKTLAMQDKAKEDQEILSYAQAQDRVLSEDPQFKQRVEAARETK